MEGTVNAIIGHMAVSHMELARISEAERHIAAHMSRMVAEIPDQYPNFDGIDTLLENSSEVTKVITAYLNSLAELEEAIASNLEIVMKELNRTDGDE